MKQRKNKKERNRRIGGKVKIMMIQYTLEKKDAQKIMAEGNLSQMCIDGFEILEILVDCDTRKVVIYGKNNINTEALLNDNAYAYIPAVEEVAEKEIGDYYISNVEIAQYLELLEIPYQWALEAIDEWRKDEDEAISVGEFWEAIDGIRTAYLISREEN